MIILDCQTSNMPIITCLNTLKIDRPGISIKSIFDLRDILHRWVLHGRTNNSSRFTMVYMSIFLSIPSNGL